MRSLWLTVVVLSLLGSSLATGQEPDAATVLAQAREAWQQESFADAVRLYRDLRDRFPTDSFVGSGDAQFWLQASLARAGGTEAAIAEGRVFLEKYPKHGSCDYVMYFIGVHAQQLGRIEEARAAWQKVIDNWPGGNMVEHAKAALEGGAGVAAPEAVPRETSFREAAEGAARWLERIAQPRGEGLAWTEYEGTRAHKVGFYEGAAGIAYYFLNLHRVTGKPEYLALAKKAARGLLDRGVRGDPGFEWKEEDEQDDGTVVAREPSLALYVGAAGIGWVMLALHDATQEPQWYEAARGAGDRIVAAAKRDAGGWSWGEDTDIISGPAGFGLFLLELHRVTGERTYLEAAAHAADGLIAVGVADGDGVKWKSAASLERFYTGASHGTAGIADFLLRVHLATKEDRYRAAAEAGARWLLRVAVAEGDGIKWFHYQPEGAQRFQTGWCHGPAGTGRLFLDLYQVTGRVEYLDAARKGAAWLMAQVDPDAKDASFYGVSMCCGAAGVGDYLLDLHLIAPEARTLEYAAGVGRFLIARAKVDGDGFKWTNYDQADDQGKIYCGTGHMIGAAGIGSFLLRLDAALRGLEGRFLPFADKTPLGAAGKPVALVPYVVLTNLDAADPYHAAARRLAEYRKGTIVPFRIGEWAALRRRLAQLQPRHVALVLRPEDVDVNLHRGLLKVACALDDDPFVDFAFGYITGPTAKDALRMVEGAIRVEAEGLPKTWFEASVVSASASYVGEGPGIPLARELGFAGKEIYWACVEDDPKVRDFVKENVGLLAGHGVVSFAGNGDPEGIWLFHDARNSDAGKHWDFDPAKVGQDPAGEMPRITADQLRGLDLAGAVVWSGTCHSGVLHREYVEGDIVATFGRVERQTEYLVPAERSLGLAILGAGPAAFLAPLGPNHGYSCLVEQVRAISTGVSLGEVMRGRYNEIALAEGAALAPATYRAGAPELHEDAMRGGGVNRVVYGDPAFRPFSAATGKSATAIAVRMDGAELKVVCTVTREDMFDSWDMFGDDQENPERLYAVVEVPAAWTGDLAGVKATARTKEGQAIALAERCLWAMEQIDGKRWLHLQANAAREALAPVGSVVEFAVSARGAGK